MRSAHGPSAGWRLVEPPQRPVLFVNPASGGGTARRVGLVDRARELGVTTRELGSGDDLAALATQAVGDGADVLGVAGGDGSLSVVAAVAHAHEIPFVCIPAGTRNHFALDLGVDRHDPLGALEAFTEAVERTIDLGSVNGRLFLNNVSLGVYGDAVHQPEYRDAKLRTLLATSREVLGPGAAPAPEVVVWDEEGREHRRPPLLLVSNNPYQLERTLAPGTRPVLDSGRLGVLVVDEPEPGRPPARAWDAVSLRVDAAETVHAGADGEAVDLEPPLAFRIVPKALRVRVAARHAADVSSAPPAA